MNFVKINTVREAYSPTDVEDTMTVGELIDFLDCNFHEDDPVILSFDRGYTYGALRIERIGSAECEEE